jgi:hypothetical protein
MDTASPLSRAAWSPRLALLAIAVLMGCARQSAPAATTPTPIESEPTATTTENETTADDTTVETVPPVAVVEPPPPPAPVVSPGGPVSLDMTEGDALRLCASLQWSQDQSTFTRREFMPGGVRLRRNSRADVLECEHTDSRAGTWVTAYLVVRWVDQDSERGEHYAEELGESYAYAFPDPSATYRLGRIERTSTGARIRVTGAETSYPGEGEPDFSGRAEVESWSVVVFCTYNAEDLYYECDRR